MQSTRADENVETEPDVRRRPRGSRMGASCLGLRMIVRIPCGPSLVVVAPMIARNDFPNDRVRPEQSPMPETIQPNEHQSETPSFRPRLEGDNDECDNESDCFTSTPRFSQSPDPSPNGITPSPSLNNLDRFEFVENDDTPVRNESDANDGLVSICADRMSIEPSDLSSQNMEENFPTAIEIPQSPCDTPNTPISREFPQLPCCESPNTPTNRSFPQTPCESSCQLSASSSTETLEPSGDDICDSLIPRTDANVSFADEDESYSITPSALSVASSSSSSSCSPSSSLVKEFFNADQTVLSQTLTDLEIKGSERTYVVGKKLGAGAFASVCYCEDKATGDAYAMKMIQHASVTQCQIDNEIQCQLQMNHPNIVRLSEVIYGEQDYMLALSYSNAGNLYNFVEKIHQKRPEGLPEVCIRYLFRQLLAAVKEIHSHGWLHRDIKLENCLLHYSTNPGHDYDEMSNDPDMALVAGLQIKVGDFGLCTSVGAEVMNESEEGNFYLAPEGEDPAPADDVWGLGCVLYTLATGVHKEELLNQLGEGKYATPSTRSGLLQHALARCLLDGPRTRITVSGLEAHPWMKADEVAHPSGRVPNRWND